MNCDCKSDIEARLLERFKESAPTGQNHGVTIAGYGFCIEGNKMTQRPYAEVTQSADMPKKTGGWTLKRSKVNMYFSYCPYCGAPVADQPPAANTTVEGASETLRHIDTTTARIRTCAGDGLCWYDDHGYRLSMYRERFRPKDGDWEMADWRPGQWSLYEDRTDSRGRSWHSHLGTFVIDDFGALVLVEGGAQ